MNIPPFVTPGAEKPDLANGSYLTFNDDTGYVAYLQVTNDRCLWLKQVDPNGTSICTVTFGPGCIESISNYVVQRLKETETK